MPCILASTLAPIYTHGSHTEPTSWEKDTLITWLYNEYVKICAINYVDREVSPEKMTNYHQQFGVLLISEANNDPHPVWKPHQNLAFRAVHDWHHIKTGAGFDMLGEIQTYHEAIKTAPPSIHWILFSEIVLQAAVAIHTGAFPAQKLVK
jgi:hypothetical protein